jgi:predicted 3-demethylubiquinone-9 3-methyltransferase (glyoxalase superfamily)
MSAEFQKITPCLWFDHEAEGAARFYAGLFGNSKIGAMARYGNEFQEITGKPPGSVMTVEFDLAGFRFIALNGGPQFRFTPAISFFVICESESEVDELWKEMTTGGVVLMELDTYDWSDKYGWVQDRFGLSWQLSLGRISDVGQPITPSLLFADDQSGRAEEAVHFYTSVFPNSNIDGFLYYSAGEGQPEGTVKHSQFGLNREKFMAMDGGTGHGFGFNEAISFQIACETQTEIDYYWSKLTAEGGRESQCGWLADRFGVSWQVVPVVLAKMLNTGDSASAKRVTRAFMQMTKFNVAALERAYAGDGP